MIVVDIYEVCKELVSTVESRRKENKDSQEKVAEAIGRSARSYGDLEREANHPSLETVAALCGYIGVDFVEMLHQAINEQKAR